MSKQPDRITDEQDAAGATGMTNLTRKTNYTGYTGALGDKDDVQGHEMTNVVSATEDDDKPNVAL